MLAIACGIALWSAFAPLNLVFMAPLAISGLTVMIARSRFWSATGWTGLTGVVFFGLLMTWLNVVGNDAWIALSIYCGAWVLLTGIGSWCVVRLPGWPVWIAAVWVAQEALRDRYPWDGFPWGRLAFSQAGAPDVGYAAIAGAPGLTFVVAFVGALLAVPFMPKPPLTQPNPAGVSGSPVHVRLVAVVCVVAGVVVWFAGLLIPRPSNGETIGGPATTTVGLIQGSVPRTGLDAFGQDQAVLNNHIEATMNLVTKIRQGTLPQPSFVIWPENATDIDPFSDKNTATLISAAVDALGVPILVGAVTANPENPEQLWNVGVVWSPGTGPGQLYVKRHPVPFGEFLPLRSVLTPLIGRFQRVPKDFAPGTMSNVLQLGPAARIGDVICFEVADDVIVRDAVVDGGRAVVVQTNNATYGGTSQLAQQAAIARIRAVEHARTVLVAATSGITMVVDPAGQIIATAPLDQQGDLVQSVALRDSLTIADRIGGWPEWIVLIVALGAIIVGIARRRRITTDRAARVG